MMNSIINSRFFMYRLLLLILVTGLWGCGGSQPRVVDTPRTPVVDLSGRSGQPEMVRNPVAVSGQRSAVKHLMQSAKRNANAGKLVTAAEILERALKIDRGSAVLWSNLADIRYQLKQFRLAESLAHKSNSFISNNLSLKLHNWQLIRNIRDARGDIPGVSRADARINKLQSL